MIEHVKEKIGLTSCQLKWIAIITMLIDHTGAILIPENMILRYIGRISFPIFCFLLTEGYCHTHNVYRYMMRLGAFALISEIPYDLAFYGKMVYLDKQNVFFTLFLGLVLLCMLQAVYTLPEKIICLIIMMWVAGILKSDYSFKGILLIFIFYIFRDRCMLKTICGVVWNFLWNRSIQKYGGFAMLPIALYNGKKGRGMQYFFYGFYPVHLLLLYMIKIYKVG